MNDAWVMPTPLNTTAATMILGPSGSGKCLGKGTPVLRYDGHIVPVEEIKEGDLLMGVGGPRRVLSTTSGEGPLYLIRPVKGTPWVCNENHILTLVSCVDGNVMDIPLPVWLEKSKTFKSIYKQVSTGAVFAEQSEPLPVDPYFLGLWFGDGTRAKYNGDLRGIRITKPDPEVHKTCEDVAAKWGLHVTETTNSSGCPTFALTTGVSGRENPLLEAIRSLIGQNLDVPHSYLTASPENRRAFLAGWLDSDGSLAHGVYNFSQKRKDWADAVSFLARSLGLRATQSEFEVAPHGIFHRVTISGDMETLPLRIPRKKPGPRKQIKDVRRTGITVELLGHGEFYGFELDGDGRFLLGDFTVTHNSTQAALVALWVAKTYRMRTHWYLYDEGGVPDIVLTLAKRGIVDLFRATSIDPDGKKQMAAGAMSLYAKGYWPAARNPDGTIIGSELLAPTITLLSLLCPSGHTVRTGANRDEVIAPGPCPECKTSVHGANGRLIRKLERAPHFENVGLVVQDSISAACGWAMSEQDERAAQGLGGGDAGRGGGRLIIKSMGIDFGAGGLPAYGFVQAQVRAWSVASSQIYGIVAPTIWTARTNRIEVSAKNISPRVGPLLIGKAAVGAAGGWFGNTIELAFADGQYRMHFRPFQEEDGTIHECKVRALPKTLPEEGYLVRTEEEVERGELFGSCDLGKLFELMRVAEAGADAFVDAFGIELPPLAEQPAAQVGEAIGSTPAGAGARPAPVARPMPVPRPVPTPAKAADVSTPFDDAAPSPASASPTEKSPSPSIRPAAGRPPMRMPVPAAPRKVGA